MANKIQLRRDTLTNWEAVNPVLGDGEPGFVIDTNQVKYGDGSTSWNDLGWGGAGLNPTSVAIGRLAGETNQADSSVAVGRSAGRYTQGEWATAVGPYAGRDTQGNEAVAVGDEAGYYHQGYGAVAIGGYGWWEGSAGSNSQGRDAVAIGASAGNNNQGAFAIAIGSGAGYNYQTTGSIAILAGENAGNIEINNAGLYINPIRNDITSTSIGLFYDADTKEITYNTVITPVPNALINGTHSVTLDSDGALTGDGANGNFYIDTITSTGTTSTWVFGVNGEFTLPHGTNISDIAAQSGRINTFLVDYVGSTATLVNNGLYLNINATGASSVQAGDIIISASGDTATITGAYPGSYNDLYWNQLAFDASITISWPITIHAADYVSGSDVTIKTHTGTGWTFGVDNTTTLPGLLSAPPKTISTSTTTGTVGQICWDANYIYVCTATNAWRRIGLGW